MYLASRSRIAIIALTLACTLGLASLAEAQTKCIITGLSSVCGGAAELCGPEGNYSYSWSGPSGFIGTTRCIQAGDSGDYTLKLHDNTTKEDFTCSHKLEVTSPPPSEITGPESVCIGEKARLCGPEGNFSYVWKNDAGQTVGTTQCIEVTTGGSYSLVTRNLSTNCQGAPSVHKVEFTKCDTKSSCPHTIGFWSQQCLQRDNGATKYSVAQMNLITACIDDKSTFFSWGDDFAGFCATMNAPMPNDQRKQAKRQFVGLLANVCAGELGQVAGNGDHVSLDPGTVFDCNGTSMTVGEFIASVDAQLASLEGQSLSLPATKTAYGRIITCADNLNNGRGITVLCGDPKDGSLGLGGEAFDEFASQPALTAEIGFGRPSPNPTAGATTITFSIIDSGTDVDVAVYDLSGRRIADLARGTMDAGSHRATWSGMTASGAKAGAGVYFVRGRVGDQSYSRSVLVVR